MIIFSGKTSPSDWLQWTQATPPGTAIYVKIDTSAAHFTGTPVYITSIGGANAHWNLTGATSIYYPTATSFQVYVRWIVNGPLTPAIAAQNGWYINWWGTSA